MKDKTMFDIEAYLEAIEGESPCCGANVILGHCEECGEPCDPVSEEEE